MCAAEGEGLHTSLQTIALLLDFQVICQSVIALGFRVYKH